MKNETSTIYVRCPKCIKLNEMKIPKLLTNEVHMDITCPNCEHVFHYDATGVNK